LSLQNLIKYYNLCYQADNRGLSIKNIYSTSIENLHFIDKKEELISGEMPFYPLENKYASETIKKIALLEKEKELIYCSTFIIGIDENSSSKSKRVCSPLFIYPASIIEEENEGENEYNLIIDKENFRINYQIFNELNLISGEENLFNEEIFKSINDYKIDNLTLGKIMSLIDKFTVNTDTSVLLDFPSLLSEQEIKKLYNRESVKEDGKYMIVPAACLCIIEKSVNTRGIINELSFLSQTEFFSLPLKTIFGNEQYTAKTETIAGKVPTVLSKSQQRIIENSSKFPFSVIIGPPGTGKTYTISALAIEKISLGQSVLIVSKTDKAVDVIAEKIENQLLLKNIIVRAGKSNYKSELISYLSSILSYYDKEEKAVTSKELLKKITKIEKEIENLKHKFNDRINDELKWGKIYSENTQNIFDNLRKKYIKWRNSHLDNHLDIIIDLQNTLNEHNKLILNYLETIYSENIQSILKNNRNELSKLLKAIRSRIGRTQEDIFKSINFSVILKVFPVWLVKMSDIYKFLPFVPELFDYVIIDEATQCDIASTLPILQRGKKAIITGDPNQLRHFSFLSASQQNIIARKSEATDYESFILDYKNNSILDIVTDAAKSNEQFIFLDEHFRSFPAIISFSNKNIYENKLKIMTSRPNISHNKGIIMINCEGVRNNAGYNEAETEKTIQIVHTVIDAEKHLDASTCSSIGILSPFRDQVEFITKKISDIFSLEVIKKHQISINTPYGFQGDERDIMILSFALDNKSNNMAFRYLNKKEVFNVSITRARKLQYLLHSLDTKQIKTDFLLRQYLESFDFVDVNTNKLNSTTKDFFATEVKAELELKGYETFIGYNVAGMEIDLITIKDNKSYGIDLIGYPDIYQQAFTIERYEILTRAGLKTYPIAYTYWKINKNECLQKFLESISAIP